LKDYLERLKRENKYLRSELEKLRLKYLQSPRTEGRLKKEDRYRYTSQPYQHIAKSLSLGKPGYDCVWLSIEEVMHVKYAIAYGMKAARERIQVAEAS